MPTRTITGDCIVRFDGRRERLQRGRVLVIIKPDDTVLVHDADGYQPVAWLTRPEELSLTREPLWLVASDGDETLRIEAAGEAPPRGASEHVSSAERSSADRSSGQSPPEDGEAADAGDVTLTDHDVSEAGVPVGDCRCGGQLIRTGGAVVCLDCADRYALPGGAAVVDDSCDCGLPLFRVERGETFDLCLDYECGSLLEAVRERFDREWDCPNCDGALRIIKRGGLLAGCEHYPDCETGFSIPNGRLADQCDCGLPRFETASGERCLDANCGGA